MAGSRNIVKHDVAIAKQDAILPGEVQVVRNLFAKGATDDELIVFQRIAERYDLDPMAREIWCICELNDDGSRKTDRNGNLKPALIQASRAGWRKVAQRDEQCAGIEAGAVYSNDDFERRPDGSVAHRIALEDRGMIVGAYALVWRHGWVRPAYAWASWKEYGAPMARDDAGKVKKWSPWAKYPSAMIEKQAESMALRQAFPLGALAAGDDRSVDDNDVIEATAAPRELEDHRRPVGDSAESSSASEGAVTPDPGEGPDVSLATSGAGPVLEPAGDELFPDDEPEEAA